MSTCVYHSRFYAGVRASLAFFDCCNDIVADISARQDFITALGEANIREFANDYPNHDVPENPGLNPVRPCNIPRFSHLETVYVLDQIAYNCDLDSVPELKRMVELVTRRFASKALVVTDCQPQFWSLLDLAVGPPKPEDVVREASAYDMPRVRGLVS